MKLKVLKYLILMGFIVWGLAVPVLAKDIYVSGVTKITMRTGPGTSHKIVAMLTSGTKLEIVEFQKDWSMVRTAGGGNGWVLSRFLTEDVPNILLVQQLKLENKSLVKTLETFREKVGKLEIKNEALPENETKYKQLQQASVDYLKLDAEYKKLLKTSGDQEIQIHTLEQNLDDEEQVWFLSGAGVFIVGFILGLSTRKKKKNSFLS